MASLLDSIIRRIVGVGIVAAIVTVLWLLYLDRAPLERAVESDLHGAAPAASPPAAAPAAAPPHAPAAEPAPAAPASGNAAPAHGNTGPVPGHNGPAPVTAPPGTAAPPAPAPAAPAKTAPQPAATPPSGAIVPSGPGPQASNISPGPPVTPEANAAAAPATPPASGAIEPAAPPAPRPAAGLAESLWGVNQPAHIGQTPPPHARAVTPPAAPAPPAFGKGARDIYAMLVAARRAAWEGRPDKAIALYRAIIRIDPRHYNAWGEMGNVLYDERRFAEAARAYEHTADLLIDAGNSWYAARLLPVLRTLAPAAAARLEARLRALTGEAPP